MLGIEFGGQIEAVVAQESHYLILADGDRSQIGQYLFAEEAADKFLVKGGYVAALVKDDVMLLQGRQNLLLVDADTVFQLAGHLIVDVLYQPDGRLYTLFAVAGGSAGYGLVVGYPNLVELFQIG